MKLLSNVTSGTVNFHTLLSHGYPLVEAVQNFFSPGHWTHMAFLQPYSWWSFCGCRKIIQFRFLRCRPLNTRSPPQILFEKLMASRMSVRPMEGWGRKGRERGKNWHIFGGLFGCKRARPAPKQTYNSRTNTSSEVVRSLKLGNVWDFVQLIHRPRRVKNQL